MKRLLALTACAMLALAACGDDDDDNEDDGDSAAVTAAQTVPVAASLPGTAVGGGTITVTATDYKFTGLPAEAPVGAQFALQNDSTKEVHEMVIVRIPDEVKETVGQLLALPEEELDAKVGETEPSAVIVALPGEVGEPVVGNGTINEPGRYAVLCYIPVGADPEVVREAMNAPPGTGTGPEEQPPIGDGPPHIMEGMYGEVVIS